MELVGQAQTLFVQAMLRGGLPLALHLLGSGLAESVPSSHRVAGGQRRQHQRDVGNDSPGLRVSVGRHEEGSDDERRHRGADE